jgi:hypothetical protein
VVADTTMLSNARATRAQSRLSPLPHLVIVLLANGLALR